MEPITLANLHTKTKREVFDYIKAHLLTQNQKSLNNHKNCVYLNSEGLKCAAGCLIAKNEYNPQFESRTWELLVEKLGLPRNHQRLIERLQQIHDIFEVCDWKGCLDDLETQLDSY